MRSIKTATLSLAAGVAVAIATTSSHSSLQAQQSPGISPQALAQISALMTEKASRTPTQQKISSRLLYAGRMARGEALPQGVPRLEMRLPDVTDRGAVVDVRAQVSQPLLDELVRLGADLLDVNARYENIRLRVPLSQIEDIAALPQIVFVQPKQEAITSRMNAPLRGAPTTAAANPVRGLRERKREDRAELIASLRSAFSQGGPIANVGSRNSEGDAKHRADSARAIYGVSGSGVRIGVISDGVDGLATAQGSGDLGAVTVLPGQAGSGAEGTAMLEIVHDLAPNAQLYFATARPTIAQFAQNIRDLRTAGCHIIVDDVGYLVETPFQDGQTASSPTNGGIVIQAVKDVTAAGALYFSSAANSGNKNDGTSGTWEGDFADGGAATGPLAGVGTVHNFGGQTFDVATTTTGPIALFWTDPLGAASNDYDIFILNSAGTTVFDFSNDVQNGTQDPFEIMAGAFTNERIVITKKSASAARFLHLNTNRGRLSISTAGETHGHAATSAPNSFGVAATSAQVNGLNPFNAGHIVENFSSDGPRRIFFQGTGAAITPGNFSSSGGQVLQKPDITAADGVSVTGAGGFPTTFYGTSAAAPHAAAIAALVLSRNLALTATQVRTALLATAIDIETPGVDRDAGYGIVMADSAAAAIPPVITMQPANQVVRRGQTATFMIAASVATTYQWQASTNAGASWTNLSNTPPFSGVMTNTLTIMNVGLNFNLVRYRCVASNAYGSTTSMGAVLRVIGAQNGTDFDGDFKADLAVFRPSTGTWYINQSSSGYANFASYQWGLSTDVLVPADYDGDGRSDLAVYRPSTGTWYVLLSGTNFTTFIAPQWGLSTDTPVPGDYDGDGKADLGVYRPSTGTWYVSLSTTNYSTFLSVQFGLSTDRPVPGDYDGDGMTDFGLYRPSTGTWFVLLSSTNYSTFIMQPWGLSTDVNATGDYDGDGKIDLGLFRPSTATWYVLLSGSNYATFLAIQWGLGTDVVVPGDYDGDNRTDLGVFRPASGIWYVLLSSTNYSTFISQPWGLSTDVPLRP